MTRSVVVVLVALAGGCTLDLDFSDTAYQCSLSGECPPGFTCLENQCKRPCEVTGCPAGSICLGAACRPDCTQTGCGPGMICLAGLCQTSPSCALSGCPTGSACVLGTCQQDVSCAADADCASGQSCLLGKCITRPDNALTLSVVVDDRANATFHPGSMAWVGTFIYDPARWSIVYDPSWGWGSASPWLFDDGPWPLGGHESLSGVAGDHVFGATVFMTATAADVTLQYHLGDDLVPDPRMGWISISGPTTTVIKAGSTGERVLPTMTIPAFGTTDMRITIDVSRLAPGWSFTGGSVQILGSFGAWVPVSLYATDGKYVFVLSEHIGASRELAYYGLMAGPMAVGWRYSLNGAWYQDSAAGVTAELRSPGGAWTSVAVTAYPEIDQIQCVIPR